MTNDLHGDTSVLSSLFRHNTWANVKLLGFCAGLDKGQLDATAVGTYGSIIDTLLHVVYAEVDYIHRVTGAVPGIPMPTHSFIGFEPLQEAARWAGDQFTRIAAGRRAKDIVRETDPEGGPTVVEYPLSSFLVQVINHATEHRTQVSTIITQLDLEPPDMAGWKYMEENGEFREFRSGDTGKDQTQP